MNPLLLISLLYLTTSLTAAAQVAGSENWPSFRGNAQLTGVSPAKISPPLTLLWSFKTDDAIKSSPVISNNTIFVGSDDGFLYALTSTGTLKWKFNAGSSIEAPPLVIDNVVFVGSLEGFFLLLMPQPESKNGNIKPMDKFPVRVTGLMDRMENRNESFSGATTISFIAWMLPMASFYGNTNPGITLTGRPPFMVKMQYLVVAMESFIK
jgi:hypothetical protein